MTLRPPPSPVPGTRVRPFPRAGLSATLCAALVSIHSTATAQDTGSTGMDLRMNGFGTLGVVDVLPHDDWGFRRDANQSAHHDQHLRADVDSRLGLQAALRLDPQWEFVA